MTDTTTNKGDDPQAIERDVQRTQDEIGETVDKLEEKLSPRAIGQSVLGEDGKELARDMLDVAKRNPIPVAMIVVGFTWLLATSNSPAIGRLRDKVTGKSGSGLRPRSEEPAPIGPPPTSGESFDRRA